MPEGCHGTGRGDVPRVVATGGGHEANCLRREQRASDNGSPVSVQPLEPFSHNDEVH